MEIIKDNYLKGSGNGPTWHVDVGPATRRVKSYFEETLETAEQVYANKAGKLFLLYSGGLDSQYVFNIFHRLKFDFTPVIIRLQGSYYNQDYNAHETKYAFEFCESKNIKPLVIDFNLDEFINSGEIVELAESARCGSYMIPATMKVAKQLEEFIVLGNDPPYMKYDISRNVWQLEELETIHSILNFFRVHNVPGCPFMLSYNPEMMLSFLLDPTMIDLANGKFPGKQGTNTSKVHVFNNGSEFNMPNYDFTTNLRRKYTGYELISKTVLYGHPNIMKFKELRQKWGGAYYVDYHEIVPKLSVNQ